MHENIRLIVELPDTRLFARSVFFARPARSTELLMATLSVAYRVEGQLRFAVNIKTGGRVWIPAALRHEMCCDISFSSK